MRNVGCPLEIKDWLYFAPNYVRPAFYHWHLGLIDSRQLSTWARGIFPWLKADHMSVQFKTFKQELWFSLWMVKRSAWWWGCVFRGLLPWLLGLHMMYLMESQAPPALKQLGCSDKGMTWGWKWSLKWSACTEIRGCL